MRRSTPTCVAASPTPLRVAHQRDHPLGEPREVVVEVLDLARAHAQHRVGVLADLRERERGARASRSASARPSLGDLAMVVPSCHAAAV